MLGRDSQLAGPPTHLLRCFAASQARIFVFSDSKRQNWISFSDHFTMDGKSKIKVGSRKSDLARVQTETVVSWLEELHPQYTFDVTYEDALGDRVLDKSLAELGTTEQPGVFTKGLEAGLLAGATRMAVHSLKDMPTTLPEGLVIGAICKRESPEDALILHPKHLAKGRSSLAELPEGSVVGSSSLRRAAFIRRKYPHLTLKDIRGNVPTRLRKLEEKDDYDAIILAAVGLRRSCLGTKITAVFEPTELPYGVSQGSIAVECRADDTEMLEMLRTIEHEESAQRCQAERSLLKGLDGGCQIAMGVITTVKEETLHLYGAVLSRDGAKMITAEASGPKSSPLELGLEVATKLKSQGAQELTGTGGPRPITYGSAETAGASG